MSCQEPESLHEDYDCQHGKNCFLHVHMYPYKGLNEIVPGQKAFSDIDGALHVGKKVLFLEFKRKDSLGIPDGQARLHRHLSEQKGQSSLFVWRDPISGKPIRCQWIRRGSEGSYIDLPNGEEDLKKEIEKWILDRK